MEVSRARSGSGLGSESGSESELESESRSGSESKSGSESSSRSVSRSGFFIELKEETKSETSTLRLPPQITRRLQPNGKLMSDEAIAFIKAAIKKLHMEQIAQFTLSKEYQETPPAQREEKFHQLKYRRYRKSELEEAIGKATLKKLGIEHLPYGVYVAEIEEDGKKKEIYAFINEGIKKFKECKSEEEFEEKIKTNILGKGNNGIVKPLHDMDDPTKCYALKITTKISETEWRYAKLAKLLLARFVRFSPSKERTQEELLMKWAPGTNLMDFFQPERNLGGTSKKKFTEGSKISPQELLSILRKLFTCVKESAHQNRFIHRDLKPSNFIYCSETGEMTLTDFGSAAVVTADGQYKDTDRIGASGFIAPESAKNSVYSFQSDIYALGTTSAMIIDMADLKTFFNTLPAKRINEGIPLLPEPCDDFINKIPQEEIRGYLIEFIKLLRAKDPNQRPSIEKCEEFMKSLENLNRIIECNADAGIERKNIKKQLVVMREPDTAFTQIYKFFVN